MADMFQIGLSGVRSSQASLATAGHNIANINTKGYSKQSVETSASIPTPSGTYFIGSGTAISGIERAYDKFAFTENLMNTSQLGHAEEVYSQNSQLDSVLSDESTGAAKPVLEVFNAVNSVADHPNMLESRKVFLESAVNMVNQYNRLYDNLELQYSGINNDIDNSAKKITRLANDIADINEKISAASLGKQSNSNDLLDERGRAITELSELVNISVVETDNAMTNVYIGGGQALVMGSESLNVVSINGSPDPAHKELAISIHDKVIKLDGNRLGGKVSAMFDTRNNDIESAFNQLGQNVIGLTHSINEQQKEGQTLEGKIGQNLFNDVNSLRSMKNRVLAENDGLGSAQLSLRIDDLGLLTPDEYKLVVNDYVAGPPEIIEFNVTNQTTGNTQTLGPVDLTNTRRIEIPNSGLSLGIDTILANDPLQAGKGFLLRPTRLAAQEVSLLHQDPTKIAAADAEIKAIPAETNTGHSKVRVNAINDPRDPLYMDAKNPLQIVVTDNQAGVVSYDIVDKNGNPVTLPPKSSNKYLRGVAGKPATPAIPAKPAVPAIPAVPASPGVPATPAVAAIPATPAIPASPAVAAIPASANLAVGEKLTGLSAITDPLSGKTTFSLAGIEVEMDGAAIAGDKFSFNYNETGNGDNRNILKIGSLQNKKIMNDNKSTFQDVYSGMLSEIGAKTKNADIAMQSAKILQTQSFERIQGASGVNMDEEAANLLQFQQNYGAAARVISIASELFDTILQASR